MKVYALKYANRPNYPIYFWKAENGTIKCFFNKHDALKKVEQIFNKYRIELELVEFKIREK